MYRISAYKDHLLSILTFTSHFNFTRACGQVFCNECSSHRVCLLKLGYTKQERVCDRCYIKHRDEVDKRGIKGSKVRLCKVMLHEERLKGIPNMAFRAG